MYGNKLTELIWCLVIQLHSTWWRFQHVSALCSAAWRTGGEDSTQYQYWMPQGQYQERRLWLGNSDIFYTLIPYSGKIRGGWFSHFLWVRSRTHKFIVSLIPPAYRSQFNIHLWKSAPSCEIPHPQNFTNHIQYAITWSYGIVVLAYKMSQPIPLSFIKWYLLYIVWYYSHLQEEQPLYMEPETHEAWVSEDCNSIIADLKSWESEDICIDLYTHYTNELGLMNIRVN